MNKVVKLAHYFFIAMWIGGLLSWFPFIFDSSVESFDKTYTHYIYLRDIAWNVIGWGGIGTFVTGVILGFTSNWRLFKSGWVTVKLVLTIGGILFGMFVIEQTLLENISILEATKEQFLNQSNFQSNHEKLRWLIVVQEILFATIIGVAVFKPSFKTRSR